jgi:hypothetical protein
MKKQLGLIILFIGGNLISTFAQVELSFSDY